MKEKKNKIRTAILAIFIILALAAVAIYALISPSSVQFPNLPTPTTIQTATTQAAGATQKTTTTQVRVEGVTTTISIPTGGGTPQPSVVTLEIKNWGFNPNIVTLLKGSTATWTNLDSAKHTVTSSGNFDSGDIAGGKTWTYTFNKAGTFQYVDKYNPSMQAKVVITE